MVNPILFIIIPLGSAFFLGLLKNRPSALQSGAAFLALTALTLISGLWVYRFLYQGAASVMVSTGGSPAPLSINLYLGSSEALVLLLVNLTALLGLFFLDPAKAGGKFSAFAYILLLVFTAGLNGLILTRDLFNLFVFLEIVSIASAGLIILKSDLPQLGAGFKFIIAGALISGFMLLGIIIIYSVGGSLNIDHLAGVMDSAARLAAFPGLFLLTAGILLELKPFPVNGWGIDPYDASIGGVGALLSAGSATALFYAFSKVAFLAGPQFVDFTLWVGGISFLGMNILALAQGRAKRLLGYSSLSQVGLLVFAYSASVKFGLEMGEFIVLGLLVTHALAKASLFWLASLLEGVSDQVQDLKRWALLRKTPAALMVMITAIFALTGFPPFPSFFAKWDLVMGLAARGGFGFIALLLAGSFIEAIYLFRWLGYALKLSPEVDAGLDKEAHSARPGGTDAGAVPERIGLLQLLPPLVTTILLLGSGYLLGDPRGISFIPLAVTVVFLLIDFLDSKIKNTLALAVVGIYSWFVFPGFFGDLFKMVFGGIFMGGALLTLLSGYYYKGRRMGFYPAALSMFFGLFMLVEAQTLLQFFYGWEFMAIGSYFLLIRGKKSMPHGYSYMLFSIGGSFAMLAGFSMAYLSSGTVALSALHHITVLPGLAYSLMLIGFMTKTATVGFHIWLPGAHGEAVADIHFMASAILLKAGVLGIVLVLLGMDRSAGYATTVLMILGWLGVLSALIGNVNAVFQESAKRLLAWSSIGQLGYILFGLASMSHLGWLIALSLAITHFLYKGILFLVVGGVSLKLGTPMMYKMGGLIRRMPFSFLGVLIAIITLSGIPPLVGFAAKWLMYQMTISEGLFFQGVVVSIAGLVAFLYLFRLIFAIFLGQLKDEHRRIGEINIWFLIPVYLLVAYIMVVSFFPGTLLRPLGQGLLAFFPENPLLWEGFRGSTPMGYFNGTLIMYVFLALFGINFLILFIMNRRAQPVKQFNIVYSLERPQRPETTHFAYNFFAPYRRAVGFLEYPFVTKFWTSLGSLLHGIAGFFRRIYTGDGQTYLVQILLFLVVAWTLVKGGI